MTRRNLGFTYAPKIPFVRIGECRQTIRRGNRWKVGDTAILFTWMGKPYRSKWSWSAEAEVVGIIPIVVTEAEVRFGGTNGGWHKWDSPLIDALAAQDFIEPPTGLALRDILLKSFAGRLDGQVIRWGVFQ